MKELIKVLKSEMSSSQLVELLETGRTEVPETETELGAIYTLHSDAVYRQAYSGDNWYFEERYQAFNSGDCRCESCNKYLAYISLGIGRVEIQCPRCKELNIFE